MEELLICKNVNKNYGNKKIGLNGINVTSMDIMILILKHILHL